MLVVMETVTPVFAAWIEIFLRIVRLEDESTRDETRLNMLHAMLDVLELQVARERKQKQNFKK